MNVSRVRRNLTAVLVPVSISCGSPSPAPSASGGSSSTGTSMGGSTSASSSQGGLGEGTTAGIAGAGTAAGGSAIAGAAPVGGVASAGGPAGGGGAMSAGGAPVGGAAPNGRPQGLPTGEARGDIAAFLESGAYKMSPWVSDTAAPRASGPFSQHPSQLRVWMNATVLTSLREMRDGDTGRPPIDQWSMVVKEMYDTEGTTLVGIAVAFKTLPSNGRDAWTFFCYGPDTRCTSRATSDKENPIYGNGNSPITTACMDCHGGRVLSPRPP